MSLSDGDKINGKNKTPPLFIKKWGFNNSIHCILDTGRSEVDFLFSENLAD